MPPSEWGEKRDAELLRLYVGQRSEAAFAVLGHRYAGLVYSACLRELGNQTQAEDAAQMVFLLLSQKASALARYETLAGWLYKASCYTCRNVRKQQRRREAVEGIAAMPESAAPAENELWERIEPHFHDALNRLKPDDREAVLLRYVQELSLSEVGVRLGVQENTARMRVSRALEKIRVHLAKAGIVVGVGALSLVMQQAVQAAPPGVLSAIARIAASQTKPPPALTGSPFDVPLSAKQITAAVCGVLVLGGGTTAAIGLLPHRLNAAEQQSQFASLSGGGDTWQGTITYLDDRDGKPYTYPTIVRFSLREAGQTLALESTYTGSPEVDTLVFSGDPRTGQFIVQNAGARISHSLWATGRLIREGGGFAFQGSDKAGTLQIRLQIVRSGDRLTVREEYRPATPLSLFSPYTLRNEFVLQRAP